MGREAAGATPDLAAMVAAALDRLAPDGPLGIAVSGGGDSVALLLAAQQWAAARGRSIEVATVDHGLRPGSAAEAAGVARQAAALGVPHRTLEAGRLPSGNINAGAREARLSLLSGWARERGLSAILLGHTLDDQAETVLMRLGRGSGADGLAGMAEASRLLGTLWLRPLLGLRRAALRDWLAARGAAWVDDPTNEDPAHLRVRLRGLVAALEGAGIPAEAIAASARRLAAQRRALDRATAVLAAQALGVGAAGEILIDRAALAAADPEIAGRLVASCIRAITGAPYAPRGEPLAAVVAGLGAPVPHGATLGGVIARPSRGGRILMCREPAAAAPPVAIGPAGAVWDARWRIGPVGEGLTLGALGEVGTRALPVVLRPEGWDAMPHVVRLTLPAIRRGDALVAIPLSRGAMPPTRDAIALARAEDLVRERLPCAPDRG